MLLLSSSSELAFGNTELVFVKLLLGVARSDGKNDLNFF